MNSTSTDHADEANKQDNLPALHTGESTTQPRRLGSFSLLRSPLFFIVTVLIVAIAVLAAQITQHLEIIILSGIAVELLATIVIWQYLQLSRRLEDITERTASLQNFATVAEQRSSSSRAAHGYTHRLLGTMSGDQSRILQSNEELKRAIKLICDHIEVFCDHIENWQNQDLEQLGEITQSLATLKNETIQDWQKQNLEHFGEITQSLATLKNETIQDWQGQNLERLGEIRQSLTTLKSETIEVWQEQNLEHLGEITQSLATLKSDTIEDRQKQNLEHLDQITKSLTTLNSAAIDDWQKLNFEHVGEITASLATLKSKTSDELRHTRESLRDSNQNAVSEVHNKLADLIRNTEERQQQALELFVSQQITNLLERTNSAQVKLKTSMAGQVQESLKELRKNLTADLSEKTALALDERLLAQSHEVVTTMTKLGGKIEKLKDHLSSIEDDLSNLTDRESNISKALEVSTALDRLNLEVRRQLSELRTELND